MIKMITLGRVSRDTRSVQAAGQVSDNQATSFNAKIVQDLDDCATTPLNAYKPSVNGTPNGFIECP
jgi:hypothetical protein